MRDLLPPDILSPQRIKRLPEVLANQIAAGEVIERPASVVKELLENALDAKASEIRIELDFGGLNLIKISDNGRGIVEDDLLLAVMAHATSKVSALADLYDIKTMGFRGEALASIASISRLCIVSKPNAQQDGAKLCFDKALGFYTQPAPRSQGTSIEVRDLFYNAPVRKKFLKGERSEYLACEAVIKRFAMSCPELALSLVHNGREIFKLPQALSATAKLARVTKLMGKAFVASAKRIEIERAGMRLEGWLSGASYQRSQNDKMWVYLNQRMVRDKLLQHAIKQAYEPLLYPGRHPACLLYLSIDSAEVDVNVHPTKHEVRFSQPRLVHDFLSSQISESLKDDSGFMIASPEEKPILATIVPTYARMLEARTAIAHPSADWIALADGYGLVYFAEGYHLFDTKSIYRHWFSTTLSNLSKPLLSRPLLVPLKLELSQGLCESVMQHSVLLADWGLRLERVNQSTLKVCSIPALVPQLDIHGFLSRFESLALTTPAILSWLIESDLQAEMLDVTTVRETLIPFIGEQLANGQALDGLMLLSAARCEAILYG